MFGEDHRIRVAAHVRHAMSLNRICLTCLMSSALIAVADQSRHRAACRQSVNGRFRR